MPDATPEENVPIVIIESAMELIDAEDEQQIIDELRGIPTDKFIYKNARGDFELSYAGTKWAVRKMAEKGEAIRIDGHPQTLICPVDAEHIIVTVLAKRVRVDKETSREIVLDSTVGSNRGWIKQKKTDGSLIQDEHFFTKCVSKATRNAQQALMPVDFKKAIIKELMNPTKAKTTDKKADQKPTTDKKPVDPPKTEVAAKSPQDTSKPSDDASAARQKVMAAFKLAIGDDVPKIRKLLKGWTGKEKTHDLDIPMMQSLTSALYKIKEGSASYDDTSVVDKLSGAVLIGVKVSSPASVAAGGSEPEMF